MIRLVSGAAAQLVVEVRAELDRHFAAVRQMASAVTTAINAAYP